MDSTEASLQPERIFVDEKWEEFLRQTDGAKGYSPSALRLKEAYDAVRAGKTVLIG